MTNELEPCAYCGLPLKLVNRPWLSGADGFEVDHVNPLEAAEKKCPMVMACYGTKEEAIEAVNTRYKRTCQMQRVKRDKYADKYECQTCYGHTWVPFGAKPEWCCHCGAEAIDD